MAYKGQITGKCGQESAYTGVGNCPTDESKTVDLAITGLNATYPMEAEAFRSGLEGWVLSTGADRIYPVKGIVENTWSGGDVATSDLGFSGTMPVGLNGANEIYRIDGGLCLYKELSKFNKQKVRVFRGDDQRKKIGTIRTVIGGDKFAGFEAKVYAYYLKATDNATVGSVYLGVWYSSNYEKEYINSHAIEADLPDGLTAITLKKGATAGTAKVVELCGNQDLTEMFEWVEPSLYLNEAGTSPTTVTLNNGSLTFEPVAAYRIKDAAALQAKDIPGVSGVAEFVNLA